jgi:hypothetical protein
MSAADTSTSPLSARSRPAPASMVNDTVFQRYEYKYSIPSRLMAPICSFLRPYCEMDGFAAREADQFYTITSLYLDSNGYKTYWDKEGEVPNRFKLRVRTYGHDSEGPVKFEVKRRINDVSRKTWLEVPRETWPSLLMPKAVGKVLNLNHAQRKALDDFVRLTRSLNAAPRMLVRYQRQAFTSSIDRYVRISFDRRIRFQPVSAYELKGQSCRWRCTDDRECTGEPGPRTILELKFTTTAPVWLVDLVRTFGLMRCGFSKYGSAVARTLGASQACSDLCMAVPAAGVMRR